MSRNMKVFTKGFDRRWFARFRTTYESINPDRPREGAVANYLDTFQGFRDFIKDGDAKKIKFVEEYLPYLGLFLHGPFPLPGKSVTPSAWDCRGKVGAYEACGVLPLLKGAKALDVGCNAGYDTFLMRHFGASESVGLEPNGFYHHAAFLNAVYDVPGVQFLKLGWEDLDPSKFRGFDFVNCQGLIYHVRAPMLLIERLATIMKSGSTLMMETHVLSEESTQAQFIERGFWGDETYWWIFGDQCLSGMLRAGGFTDIRMPLKADCSSRNPSDPKFTVEGYPAGARAWFVATRV